MPARSSIRLGVRITPATRVTPNLLGTQFRLRTNELGIIRILDGTIQRDMSEFDAIMAEFEETMNEFDQVYDEYEAEMNEFHRIFRSSGTEFDRVMNVYRDGRATRSAAD